MRVDKGLEDAPYLEAGRGVTAACGGFELVQEAEFHHFVDGGVDLVDQARLVGTCRQEHPHQFHHVVAREHQPRIATSRIKFDHFFAQQGQQQANGKRQRATRHQAWQAGSVRFVASGFRSTFEKGVAFGLIDHQFQPQHAHVVAHMGLQVHQAGPQALVGFAVLHAFEQTDQQHRQMGIDGQ